MRFAPREMRAWAVAEEGLRARPAMGMDLERRGEAIEPPWMPVMPQMKILGDIVLVVIVWLVSVVLCVCAWSCK